MHDRRSIRFFKVSGRSYPYRVVIQGQHMDRTDIALTWLEQRCPRSTGLWDYAPQSMIMTSQNWGVTWNDITDIEFVFDDQELAFEFKLRWG